MPFCHCRSYLFCDDSRSKKRHAYIKNLLLKNGYTDKQFKTDDTLKSAVNTIPFRAIRYSVTVPDNNQLGESLLKNKLQMIDDLSVLFGNDTRPVTTASVNIKAIEQALKGISQINKAEIWGLL
jgi:hypothetical protein